MNHPSAQADISFLCNVSKFQQRLVHFAFCFVLFQQSNDLQTKGKDFVRPRFEKVREQLNPLRTWAGDTAKKWHLEKEDTFKENPLIKELSRTLGAKSSN